MLNTFILVLSCQTVFEADFLVFSVHFDEPVASWWISSDRATGHRTELLPCHHPASLSV